VLGQLALFLATRPGEASGYFLKLRQAISFLGFFGWQLVLSNLRVAYDIVTPRHHMRPGVVAIPLDARTDAETITLANLITLTPGTLSLDVSPDHRVLYIHAMYIDDLETLRRGIKEGLERRVLELLR
jgi:multicomponent Na+:H+ antiporter subunit E